MQHDEPGMSEFEGVRYLHFGTKWIQGAMNIARPDELVLDYTRQMMAWLLFREPKPQDRIVVLGLGAGSLLRYVLRHTPAQTVTVEWNPAVIAVCRAFFRLPDVSRSTLVQDDARAWAANAGNHAASAAILVDLYDGQARGPVCDTVDFYQDCRRCLDDRGVLVVNLFGNHESYTPNVRNLHTAFEGRVLQLPQTSAGNRIVFGFQPAALEVGIGHVMQRAEEMERTLGLPAVRWARSLLDKNEAGISLCDKSRESR